jgi:hypothetical protein
MPRSPAATKLVCCACCFVVQPVRLQVTHPTSSRRQVRPPNRPVRYCFLFSAPPPTDPSRLRPQVASPASPAPAPHPPTSVSNSGPVQHATVPTPQVTSPRPGGSTLTCQGAVQCWRIPPDLRAVLNGGRIYTPRA